MQDKIVKKKTRRVSPRNPPEAAITCRPYASTDPINSSAGVMRKFSSQGSYIETSNNSQSGTILVMRMVRHPAILPFIADEERSRSIGLAEVKWRQELAGENESGMASV